MGKGYICDDVDVVSKLHFLHLPPEIHGHVIRYCGVSDIYSLALVNHFLNNVVRSKLHDFLIAGCQNDYFEDIDRLYEFPDEPQSLWKVVRTIRRLDQFRSAIIHVVRWDIFKDCPYDKRRTIYLLDHYHRLCLPWGRDIPWYQRFSSDGCPSFRKQLLDCLSMRDIQNLISTEKIMIEQLSHYLSWPHFHAIGWSEALVGRGLEYFLRIVQCNSVPRKRRLMPVWTAWPWNRANQAVQGELDVSDDIYDILCEVVRRPATRHVLVSQSYQSEKEDEGENEIPIKRVEMTELSDMWRVVI